MWPIKKKKKDFILTQQSDEYYEDLAFRLLQYVDLKFELRHLRDFTWSGIKQNNGDRICLNMVIGHRDEIFFSVLAHGPFCSKNENPFEKFLEMFCKRIASGTTHPYFSRYSLLNMCFSPSELNIRLTANGI